MGTKKNIVGDLHNVRYARIGDELHIHLAEQTLPKELTLNIPRIHPDDLIGREEDLEQLHASLHADKRVVVVNGLGGIGKTTLARAYVSRYYEEYHHILWITQDSEDVARDFVNAAGLIRSLGVEATATEPGLVFEEIIRKLKCIRVQPNLLIIDNGERSLKRYRDLLPGQPHWHLLVTSREAIAGFHHQSLGFLSEEQAIRLFKKHYPHRTIDDKGISKLVKAVGYHTLTIEILAKMAAMQRYELPALLQAIKKDLKANIEIAHSQPTGAIEKIGAYLGTTFKLSRLGLQEIWILKQLVCLPPEPQSYRLLRELLIDEQGPYALTFAETLTNLADKGWLLYSPANDSYSMHRIIAEVIRKEDAIRIEDVAHLLARISDRLNVLYTVDNTYDKFEWVPYGKALLTMFPRSNFPGIAELQNRLGFVLFSLGDLDQAKVILEKAIRSDEKNFGKGNPKATMSYNNLALVLWHQGDHKTAKALLRKAARYDEKNLGPRHHHTTMRYKNLAAILLDEEDYEGARPLFQKAIEIEKKEFGARHPLITRNNAMLATVMRDMGETGTAISLLKEAVKSDEKYYGEGHPAIMNNYDLLADLLHKTGKYADARSLYEKVLQATEKVFGPDHPKTAKSCNNLALVLSELGEHAAAKPLFENTLRIDEKNYGLMHEDTLTSIVNLGLEHSDMGDYAAAKVMLEKAVHISKKLFGRENMTTMAHYWDLAEVLYKMKDYRAAKLFYEKAISGYEKHLGKKDLLTADLYHDLAKTLVELKEFRQARELIRKVIPVFKKELPKRDKKLREAMETSKVIL